MQVNELLKLKVNTEDDVGVFGFGRPPLLAANSTSNRVVVASSAR
jgi:hypothetical protein